MLSLKFSDSRHYGVNFHSVRISGESTCKSGIDKGIKVTAKTILSPIADRRLSRERFFPQVCQYSELGGQGQDIRSEKSDCGLRDALQCPVLTYISGK